MAETLPLRDLKYTDLLGAAAILKLDSAAPGCTVALLANVVVEPVRDVLEYALRAHGINARVVCGDYDNIVQDTERFREANAVLVFWEAANLSDGLHHRIYTMGDSARQALLEHTMAQVQLAASRLRESSIVLFNSFSSLPFCVAHSDYDPFNDLCAGLNAGLSALKGHSLKVVDLDAIYAQLSIPRSIGWRDYYSSKAFYSFEFAKAYVEHVLPVFLAANGRARKALIFDCDGTLWKGIVGEDGIGGIQVGPGPGPGQIFYEVQNLALALRRQGVLLGLCSKNNPEDVDEVLRNHPGMLLRPEHFAIRKVNWNDKVANLTEIAAELSIGNDSLVFVDDSDFEIRLVREQLPQVAVIQVPGRLHEYPGEMRRHLGLFYTLSRTSEDAMRAQSYAEQAQREERRKTFASTEDFLRSLDLRVTIFIDSEALIPRMAQLTQKTNQFNLTTRRYTESDLETMVHSARYLIAAISLADCFGDYGLTGLAIIEIDAAAGTARVDTMLMSCRIIGRNVELAFFDILVEKMKSLGVRCLDASYNRAAKNGQVAGLYDRLGLTLVEGNENQRSYRIACENYVPSKTDYIKVTNG